MSTSIDQHSARSGRPDQATRRRHIEQTLDLASHLPRDERVLYEQVYLHGQPVAGLAALAKVRPRVLYDRLKRIRERMKTREFKVTSECLELLPANYRTVARYRFLHGLSVAKTARAAGLTPYQVRQREQAVRALLRVAPRLMAAHALGVLGDCDDVDGSPLKKVNGY